MIDSNMNWLANFIWGIADDVLRDLYVRGKYRDVILPMTVPRRLDALLEPTEQAVVDMKLLQSALAKRDDAAQPVIKKTHKPGKASPAPLRGLFETTVSGKKVVVEYEPDSELRDTEQVPLNEDGGIEAFIRREVLPHVPDAYKPQPRLSLDATRADILALENETKGLLTEIVCGGA